jgi:hypothetical protein
MGRKSGASYRRGAGKKRAGIKAELKRGRGLLLGLGLRRAFRLEEEEPDSGVHLSAR